MDQRRIQIDVEVQMGSSDATGRAELADWRTSAEDRTDGGLARGKVAAQLQESPGRECRAHRRRAIGSPHGNEGRR